MAVRVALQCDSCGVISSIFSGSAMVGDSFASLLDPAALETSRSFLDAIAREGVACDWQMSLRESPFPEPLRFAGIRCESGYCIIGQDARSESSSTAQMQREMAQRNAALERSNHELSQLAAILSHDLQAPLRNIRQFANLFREKVTLPNDAAIWLQHMVDNVDRMQRMIDDSLGYARMGNTAVVFEPVPLNEVVDLFAGSQVTRGDLPVVSGVRTQIEVLLQNLIENALTYRGQAPPRVHITAARDGSHWRVAVRDNGCGIAQEDHSRIFEMFTRVHTDGTGTGIGLCTCRQVVQRHRGEIWVESALGKGSTFYFTLPAATPTSHGSTPV